jgi:hypothetical protein
MLKGDETGEHVIHMKGKNAYKILIENYERKNIPIKPRRIREIYIKMDLIE